MKKIFVFLMVGLMLAAAAATAAPAPKEKAAKAEKAEKAEKAAPAKEKAASKAQPSGPVTHVQLAELLVKALGLVRYLPVAPSAQQTFDLLMQNGISPQGGWLLDAVVTKADLARVLVQALNMQDQVENPSDPQSWIDALKAAGISLDRLSEAIRSVETLPDGMGQDVKLQSTDPLVYGVNFAPGDSIQYTVDLNLVTRVFTEVQMISGEFRPASPTPF